MRMVSAIIAFVLLVFTVLHVFIPNHLFAAAVYGVGAFLALVTVRPRGMGIYTARFFALSTTVVMFFCFAAFFTMAPGFEDGWHRTGAALEGFGMLLSAFLMIPILSCYSCVLKGEGCDHLKNSEDSKRGAFFSVPKDLQQHS